MSALIWLIAGICVGTVGTIVGQILARRKARNADSLPKMLARHFRPISTQQITVSERVFPFRVRADLQKSLDQILGDGFRIEHFCGVRIGISHSGISLADCFKEQIYGSAESVPPEYEAMDIGDATPLRVLKIGFWLLKKEQFPLALLAAPKGSFTGDVTGIILQVATCNSPEGSQLSQTFFDRLEKLLQRMESYRGKILSLEQSPGYYTGQSTGIQVHKLRQVERDQVILPEQTLKLLERNVMQFVRHRAKLAELSLSSKKGLLFYGPPGTGKTHTIHYLAGFLPGHTTMQISGDQVGMLKEYMTLARLLQPSIVVMEDVDLIARAREQMRSPCEESVLNILLNEMDGLKEDAEILFLLTTNHPESLEAALSSRPGRIDQAIEFPLPEEEGRRKLASLYSQGMQLSDDVFSSIVRRTEGVSGAFIKELMRRSAQVCLERNGNTNLVVEDIDSALNEMLFQGGSLNLKILGAGRIGFGSSGTSESKERGNGCANSV